MIEVLFLLCTSIAREKRQPLQESMIPCTAESSFGRAMLLAVTT